MLFAKSNGTTEQGNIGLSRAIYEFTRLGFTALMPLTDCNQYDLVVEKNGAFQRVQVKTTSTLIEGLFHINLMKVETKRNIRKRPTDYDLLFVLTSDNECFLLPSTILPNRRLALPSISCLNSKYAKYRLGDQKIAD